MLSPRLGARGSVRAFVIASTARVQTVLARSLTSPFPGRLTSKEKSGSIGEPDFVSIAKRKLTLRPELPIPPSLAEHRHPE